jgi:hypothetical protein
VSAWELATALKSFRLVLLNHQRPVAQQLELHGTISDSRLMFFHHQRPAAQPNAPVRITINGPNELAGWR